MAWVMPHVLYCLGFPANQTPAVLWRRRTRVCTALSPSVASRYHVPTTRTRERIARKKRALVWLLCRNIFEVNYVMLLRYNMADAYAVGRLAVNDTMPTRGTQRRD